MPRIDLKSLATGQSHDLLNRINATNLRGDAFGGLTAAVIALPMALAFGVAATGDPAPGLWGAVIIGLVAAVFGGDPHSDLGAHRSDDGGVHFRDLELYGHGAR